MKILMIIEYKGTNFSGWQSQPNKRTVQNEIELVLSTIFNEKISVHGSGRTDAGVHALGQTAHFEFKNNRFCENNKFNKNRFLLAVNSNLPEDIKILKAKKVADHFHARYDVKEKIYLYKLQIGSSPLKIGLAGNFKKNLDIEKMQEAAKYLTGEHDFSSFCSSKTRVTNFVRTINYIKIKKESGNIINFEISGNGFLYNMVRIIVGTLVDMGTYKFNPHDIKTILENKARSSAGKTAPAEGLYLKKVSY